MHRTKLMAFVWILLITFVSTALAQDHYKAVYGEGSQAFSLATGSPGELGLLKVLGETFAEQQNARLQWRKAGSGASLKLLQEKQVDMVMVHAPTAEKKAVAEGWATRRTLIGSNEFYVVGPKSDPAKVAEANSVTDAYTRIAAARAKFFSRGDNSGTNKKELAIWKKADVDPSGGHWYIITHDFMTATLRRANDEGGYFMTDSSTWIAEKDNMPNLRVLFKGDTFIVNTYHALCQPAGATPGAATAAKFIDFVASKQGQAIIRNYGKATYGEGLYNDAAYAKQFDH